MLIWQQCSQTRSEHRHDLRPGERYDDSQTKWTLPSADGRTAIRITTENDAIIIAISGQAKAVAYVEAAFDRSVEIGQMAFDGEYVLVVLAQRAQRLCQPEQVIAIAPAGSH